jgi:predicted CopG family antitoxin
MNANPGVQRELYERLVVSKREADSIAHLIEQEKETIGAIDFAAAMLGEKLARTPVV